MSNMSFHYDVSGFVRREGIRMSRTVVRKNESLEDALRRFKRSVSKTGTLQEARKREFYEKPSETRRRARLRAERRARVGSMPTRAMV